MQILPFVELKEMQIKMVRFSKIKVIAPYLESVLKWHSHILMVGV